MPMDKLPPPKAIFATPISALVSQFGRSPESIPSHQSSQRRPSSAGIVGRRVGPRHRGGKARPVLWAGFPPDEPIGDGTRRMMGAVLVLLAAVVAPHSPGTG